MAVINHAKRYFWWNIKIPFYIDFYIDFYNQFLFIINKFF